jgi:hypothetical protein
MVTDLKERFIFLDPLNNDSVACISLVCMVVMLIEFTELKGRKIWVLYSQQNFVPMRDERHYTVTLYTEVIWYCDCNQIKDTNCSKCLVGGNLLKVTQDYV